MTNFSFWGVQKWSKTGLNGLEMGRPGWFFVKRDFFHHWHFFCFDFCDLFDSSGLTQGGGGQPAAFSQPAQNFQFLSWTPMGSLRTPRTRPFFELACQTGQQTPLSRLLRWRITVSCTRSRSWRTLSVIWVTQTLSTTPCWYAPPPSILRQLCGVSVSLLRQVSDTDHFEPQIQHANVLCCFFCNSSNSQGVRRT